MDLQRLDVSNASVPAGDRNVASKWAGHENEIIARYVDQNQTLDDIRKFMKDNHGLEASLSQYKKRFRGLKNLKVHEWIAVIEEVERRSIAGIPSEVYLYGKPIGKIRLQEKKRRYRKKADEPSIRRDAQKVMIGRDPRDRIAVLPVPHNSPSQVRLSPMEAAIEPDAVVEQPNLAVAEIAAANTEPTGGIGAAPMTTEHWSSYRPDYDDIWKQTGETRRGRETREPGRSLGSVHVGNIDRDSSAVAVELPYFQLKQLLRGQGFANAFLETMLEPASFLRIESPCHPTKEELGLFFGMELGAVSKSNRQSAIPSFVSHLSPQIPETSEGELAQTVTALLNKYNAYAIRCVFETIGFLASNNKLTSRNIKHFLIYIAENGYFALLERFLRINNPTTRAATPFFVDAAISSRRTDLLRSVFAAGVDFRPLTHKIILIEDDDFARSHLLRLRNEELSGSAGGRLLVYLGETSNVKAATFVIENGADVNLICEVNGSIRTALINAVSNEKLGMVQLLLEKGADPNLAPPNHDVPIAVVLRAAVLHPYAPTRSLYFDLIGDLLKHGADIKRKISEESLLDYTSRKNFELYMFLLAKSGTTAPLVTVWDIIHATRQSTYSFTKYLQQHNEQITQRQLEMALYELAQDGGSLAAISILLASGADPNTPTLGQPLLSLLPEGDEFRPLQLTELLIEAGATVNYSDLFGQAAATGNIALLERVLRYGADLSIFGPEALVTAASQLNIEACNFLLDKGVDVNAFGDHETPLYAAVETGDVQLAKYLIDRGANVNATPPKRPGWTPLHAACDMGKVEMVEFLLASGAEVNPPNTSPVFTALGALLRGSAEAVVKVELVQILVRNGLDVTRCDRLEPSGILPIIIQYDQSEIFDIVLKLGIDVNRMTFGKNSGTPIQLAAGKGRLGMVRALFNHGAQINGSLASEYGKTALQAAAANSSPNMELLRFLIDKGADVNAAPSYLGGLTAIQAAAAAGNIPVIKYLVSKGGRLHDKPSSVGSGTAIEAAAENGRLDTVKWLLIQYRRREIAISIVELKLAMALAKGNGHLEVADMLKSAAAAWRG